MNEINRTGKMYVVWHNHEEVQTQQEGIDKVIESIGFTGAEYGGSVGDIGRTVRQTAIEYFNDEDRGGFYPQEVNPISGAKPGSKEYRQAVQEFGERAVYEVRVRYVGTVNAEGKFTKIQERENRND